MRVLSLCDGLSGGLLAFKQLGIQVDYFAVEIDKYPRQISEHNFEFEIERPTDDVNSITEEMVRKLGPFDWVMFGSPCQSISMSGKQEGLKGSSGLLLKCLEVLRWAQKYNPDLKFLIENVKMKKEFLLQFNELIGVAPVLLNSALVSAQSRARYYWTNFPITQPTDRGVVVADILENLSEVEEASNALSEKLIQGFNNKPGTFNRRFNPLSLNDQKIKKAYCLTTRYNKTAVTDPYVECPIRVGTALDIKGRDSLKRIYSPEGKCPTLTAVCGGHQEKKISVDNLRYRKLTVRECARLQTIPDWFEFPTSKTQAYKSIGNGWTIEVISHIIACGLKLRDEDLV